LTLGEAAHWTDNVPVDEETGTVDEMSIGEFARRSRLSPKALRLYDELGLLAPARVDDSSGYRFYDAGQLERVAPPRRVPRRPNQWKEIDHVRSQHT